MEGVNLWVLPTAALSYTCVRTATSPVFNAPDIIVGETFELIFPS